MYTQLNEETIKVVEDSAGVSNIYNLHLVGEEWQKLNGEVVELPDDVQWLTDEDRAEAEEQAAIEAFRANRQAQLDSAAVTVNNHQFDADEKSILRMGAAIEAAKDDGRTELQWSLADTGTGVMTDITLDELKEARRLAVLNMAEIWSIDE